MNPPLAVGQHWRTRCGTVVRVTCDRAEFAVNVRWRWACSNSRIVDDAGREGLEGASSPHDLVEFLPGPNVSDASVRAMDSTWGRLHG